MLGVFVGNAAGASLEYSEDTDVDVITAKVEDAMNMLGGGETTVGPGQIGHTSETAIHLLHALLGHEPRDGFPANAVAAQYIQYWGTHPEDAGTSLLCAFGMGAVDARSMRSKARYYNSNSKSNTALARIAALAIWAHKKVNTEELMIMAREDTRLSHPRPVCMDASATYCVALASLLGSNARSRPNMEVPTSVAERASAAISCVEDIIGEMHYSVQEWFHASSDMNLSEIDVRIEMRLAKWGFLLAFYFLRRATPFEIAIKETCMKLGNCDVNAAIVGGMLGALHGRAGIPSTMSDPVMLFDPVLPPGTPLLYGYPRPATYRVQYAMALLQNL